MGMVDFIKKFGREITTILSAKEELWKEPSKFNPLDDLVLINKECGYFGRNHTRADNKAVQIPSEAINHILLCGITRSGKGIMASIKGVEAIQKGKGLIYIDVKQEEWTPQCFIEELERQNRKEDFLLVNWPNDFGYTGLNSDDTIFEIHEKAIVLLDLGLSSEAGVDHYRENERMTFFRILEEGLNKHFKPDWYEILHFIECLIEDFDAQAEYAKEYSKSKPNHDRLEELSHRYFDTALLKKLKFRPKNIDALSSLYIKLSETLSGASVCKTISIDEALYNGKVVYIKADMLSLQSLKFLKLLFIDMTQKARKKKANTLVIADEISFYATVLLSAQLSVSAGFGLQFILQLQDLGQLPAELRNPILTNCSAKLYYKISTSDTLDEVERLGGEEAIRIWSTSMTSNTEDTVRAGTEPLLNATRIRAMWYARNAIFIAEYLNTSIFIQTSSIPVKHPFDWNSAKIETKVSVEKREKQKKFEVKIEAKNDDEKLSFGGGGDDDF